MLRGDRLKSLRLGRSYSHQKLAELLSISIRQIGRYEDGEVEPSGEVIARMADLFDVTTDYLLGRTDDPTPCAEIATLSPQEHAIISALRRGELLEAIKAILAGYH